MNESAGVNPDNSASFVQYERYTEPLCGFLENILDKKIQGVALNILEAFIDFVASFFDSYNHRETYLSRIFSVDHERILNDRMQHSIQVTEKSGELVFHAEGLSNLLMTTIESLRCSIIQKKFQGFKNVEVQLIINESKYNAILPAKEDNTNYSLDDLAMLEKSVEPLIGKITEEVSGSGSKLSIDWDFILVDDAGRHTFSFIFKKTPNSEMIGGALFGSPGYRFESHDYKTLDLPF